MAFNQDTPGGVPRRPFGDKGVSVSKLCLGGSSVLGADGRAVMDEALRFGVDCWEFNPFTGSAFGEYFAAHPGVRERVFLSAKTSSTVPSVMQQQLEQALTVNETSAIDFFAVHGVDDVGVLTEDVRKWAEKVKLDGKVRFFGFCTHKRVEDCLRRAASLDWIDGIQAFYNYRTQLTGDTDEALSRCHAKGIAVFTVKSMGLCVKNEAELPGLPVSRGQVLECFSRLGLSFEQAKLRAIWQNPQVTSVCSLMPSASIVQANAAAAMDERPLEREVAALLAAYADSTSTYFCRRCGSCDTATLVRIPIFNVMEALMYARGYGSRELAMKLFSMIPAETRAKLLDSDYSKAESTCPQRMPIAQLMREACLALSA